ncbi:MAG: hypothetical protein GY822_05295 [Deltaproteobacteria bacterium]|nr:hypothetical protein [Deltaproteobacteria bacterium]
MKSTIIETILKLFDVSREEAEIHATEFIDFVESKGGDIDSLSVIENQVPKILGERLKWRSAEIKQKKKKKTETIEKSYNNYLNGKNKPKW